MPNTLIKSTPLHAISRQFNPHYTEQQGWEIPKVYTTVDAELSAARHRVAVADATPNGKLMVRGSQAQEFLNKVIGLPLIAVNTGREIMGMRVYRLRNDLYYISTLPGNEADINKKLQEKANETDKFITITDVTHGRSEILIVGPNSPELMSKLCGLDFHPYAFPNETAKQSSLAKTTQLIIRRDNKKLPAFFIIGATSLGEYLWNIIIEAGREWDLIPIGFDALNTLQE